MEILDKVLTYDFTITANYIVFYIACFKKCCPLQYQVCDWVTDLIMVQVPYEINYYDGVTLYMRRSNRRIYSWTKRLWQRCSPEILLLTGPSPVTAHWVAYQWNLQQTWEWAFPALWDKMVLKCPLNHGQSHGHKRALLW